MDFSTAKIILDLDGKPGGISVMAGDTHLSIPMIEGNTDYREYLAWLAEGNEPSPPDEPPTE
jgi:hypothetical protein